MSYAKDTHYWQQLRLALTAGNWAAQDPARAPNSVPLSWPELYRKFKKHCRGFDDIVEIASRTQALGLLLEDESNAHDDVSTYGSLSIGTDCMLRPQWHQEVNEGLEALKKLGSSESGNLVIAYYAFALGHPEECIDYLSKVPNLLELSIQSSSGTTSSNNSTLSSRTAWTDTTSSARPGSTISGESVNVASIAEIKNGQAWAAVEALRSLCLKGMSQELLSPRDLDKSLQTYQSALPVLSALSTTLPSTAPPTSQTLGRGPSQVEFTSFRPFQELWRWVERLLRRAVILAAKKATVSESDAVTKYHGMLLSFCAQYHSCATHWPPQFRSRQRSTVAVIHLRALVLSVEPLMPMASFDLEKAPVWFSTARSIIQDYRTVLDASTHFPRSGERNVPVEDLVELTMAVWEAAGARGEWSGWVTDLLWWATRLTFNSYRIFAHMSRLAYVAGDYSLAVRTFNLYVQIVSKAHLAESDADTDRRWVETLVQGVRMLCRLVGDDASKVRKEGKDAGIILEKARSRLDKEDKVLCASVDLAEGIWNMVMAHQERDPRTRADRLDSAYKLILRSHETNPTPSSAYHLALILSRPGPNHNLDEAIVLAGDAAEGARSEIKAWHLLGILLGIKEVWPAAKSILETGASIGETVTDIHGFAGEDVSARDFATTDPSAEDKNSQTNGAASNASTNKSIVPSGPVDLSHLLSSDLSSFPPASDLLMPMEDHPRPSRRELLEQALQLRMTQVVFSEHTEGPEKAVERFRDLFIWVAEKSGAANASDESRRGSIDTRRSQEATRAPSSYQSSTLQVEEKSADHHSLISSLQDPPSTKAPSVLQQRRISTDTVKPTNPTLKRVDSSTGKKVQRILKDRVQKQQARMVTISKKIGGGVTRNGTRHLSLRRSTSAPGFLDVDQPNHYQASSIHSRRRIGSIIQQKFHGHSHQHLRPADSPPPPPPPALPPVQDQTRGSIKSQREKRLINDLWLMSAAIFRRLGKIEQAKGSIQEAEVRDEDNPAVWVQLGLYYTAMEQYPQATDAFHKALFISVDDVPATIHLCRLYLTSPANGHNTAPPSTDVDIAASMLERLTRGPGWDVPEAWFYLSKAYGYQGRKQSQRDCRAFALTLSETRGIRDIGAALGWSL